jgi:uncharacterized membrane-anchored protein
MKYTSTYWHCEKCRDYHEHIIEKRVYEDGHVFQCIIWIKSPNNIITNKFSKDNNINNINYLLNRSGYIKKISKEDVFLLML